MRSLYSNLIKRGSFIKETDKRVIDSNSLIAEKIHLIKASIQPPENDGQLGNDVLEEGFVAGIEAEPIDTLLMEESPSKEELLMQAKEEIAKMQINERVRFEKELEEERVNVLNKANKEGFEAGNTQAMKQLKEQTDALEAEKKKLEEMYEKLIDELEPQFIDTLTGIYEHIFHVELGSYREIIIHLITYTMRKIEGSRDFIIHVSKDDYPFVSMQKKQIIAGVGTANTSMEIVEDITLNRNECLIETSSGIFDCGLGTQLAELSQKLKLLSYEKPVEK